MDQTLEKYPPGCEENTPLSDLAKFREEIVKLERSLGEWEESMVMPNLTKPKKNGASRAKRSVQEMLESFSDKSLTCETLKNNCYIHYGYYQPAFMKTLHVAVIGNDLETVKRILEDPKMTLKAIKYIMKYKFNCNILNSRKKRWLPREEWWLPVAGAEADMDSSLGSLDPDPHHALACRWARKYPEQKCCSLILLAACYHHEDMVRYLLKFEGSNLLETCGGSNISHHLLCREKIPKSVEGLLEEIWKKEPKLVETLDWQNKNMLQLAALCESPHICRVLVKEYKQDLDVVHDKKDTALVISIKKKNIELFNELVTLGASPLTLGKRNRSAFLEACRRNWPEAIRVLLPLCPGILKEKIGNRYSPLELAVFCNSVEAIETIYKCAKRSEIPAEFQNKQHLIDLATNRSSDKVLKWLQTAEI